MGRVVLTILLCCCVLHSQPADPLAVEQRIYAALAKTLAPSPSTILILFDPGIALDAWADPNAEQVQSRLAQIANDGLKLSPMRTSNSGTVSSIYEQILRRESWGELVLDKSQQQQLADANKVLYKDPVQKTPTAGYALYLQLEDRYIKAQAIWDSTSEDKRTETMRVELDAATKDLELRGNAALYESNLENLEVIASTQPIRLRDRWIAQLEGSTVISPNGHRSVPVSFIPAISFDYAKRWTAVRADNSPVQPTISALPWPQDYAGPWRYCGSSTFSDADLRSPTAATSPAVTLEATAVAVSRPWLDEEVFSYRGWKMRDPAGMISSGSSPSGNQPQGLLPIVITHIVFARNVTVEGQLPQSELAKLTGQSLAGKCTSFGPFVVAGNTELGNGTVLAFPFGGGFYSPNTQIVGVLAKPLPKSPNPDLTHYRWP